MRLVNGHVNYIYIVSQIKNGPIGDFSEYSFLTLLFIYSVLTS